jgi:hypothetical protein
MKQRRLIGIVGPIGSGKTSMEEYLTRKYRFSKYAFAEPLKEIAMNFGFTRSQVYGTQQEKLEINRLWNISGREFLQKFGSEVCRDTFPAIFPSIDKSIWVKLFEHKYNNSEIPLLVISDVRFHDEAVTIKNLGGTLVRIIPQEVVMCNSFHQSESHFSNIKCDYVIYNPMNPDFYHNIDDFMCNIHSN